MPGGRKDVRAESPNLSPSTSQTPNPSPRRAQSFKNSFQLQKIGQDQAPRRRFPHLHFVLMTITDTSVFGWHLAGRDILITGIPNSQSIVPLIQESASERESPPRPSLSSSPQSRCERRLSRLPPVQPSTPRAPRRPSARSCSCCRDRDMNMTRRSGMTRSRGAGMTRPACGRQQSQT